MLTSNSHPRDRTHDRRPASLGLAKTGTVLGCDVPSGIQIGVKLEAARWTLKPATGATVVTGGVPAPTARLGGMSRINRDHRTAALLSLVLDEGPDLVERPAMNASGLLAVPGLDPSTDVLQVLQDTRPPG